MYSHQKFFLIFIITAASIMATCISPYIAIIGDFFCINSSSLTKVMSSYLLGYLIGQYIFSKFSKKYNGLLSIRVGLIVATAGFILQKLSFQFNTYSVFLIGRFITSLGLSSGLVVGFAIIKDNISSKNEKSYLSKIAMAFTVSIYLSIVISGYLSKIISVDFLFSGLIFYPVMLIPITFYLPNTKKNIIQTNLHLDFKEFLNPKLIRYSFTLSITTLIAYLYAFYGPLIFIKKFGFSSNDFSKINLINMIGVLLGSFLYPKFSRYLNEKHLVNYLLCLLILNMFFLINLNSDSYQQFIIIFFISNIFSGLLYPASTYLALGCGICKTTSSATMNIIKIGLPVVGFYFSSILRLNDINKLGLTIITFITFTLFLILLDILSNNRVFDKKTS